MEEKKGLWERFCNQMRSHPVVTTIVIDLVLTGLFSLIRCIAVGENIQYVFLLMMALSMIFLPCFTTLLNLIFCFVHPRSKQEETGIKTMELFELLLGIICTIFYVDALTDIHFVDWTEQLYNQQLHSPIATEQIPYMLVLAVISVIGYLYLRWIPLKKQPPLTTLLSMSMMYLGVVLCVVYCIQLHQGVIAMDGGYLILDVLPIYFIFLVVKTVVLVVKEKQEQMLAEKLESNNTAEGTEKYFFSNPFLRMLNKTYLWPIYALVLAAPLLGIIVALATVFGQAPDAIIRAWTDTADWTFSKKIPPQNIEYDEHYLCTVAAGGHKEVVHPLRTGKRHGHRVIVNRQLCIANAFEQLLEERTPKFHRVLRGFYDKTGYPIAKHIHSPYVADIIYFIMKPLEWIFLMVLYLFDVKPENRIAVQYPHAPLPRTLK